MKYDSGYADCVENWVGKFSNRQFEYFARHNSGRVIDYKFNSLGYRGPEHHKHPDISIFGSSFSFGIGIEHSQCWHQLLGNYRVNSYAIAGFLITNNDIVDHHRTTSINTGITIIQLREFKYNKSNFVLPDTEFCFLIDEFKHAIIPTFKWSSIIDKAEDGVHPGPNTHLVWSKIIKKMCNL
jgi:hypothetical protein